jgi:hypothetical protein
MHAAPAVSCAKLCKERTRAYRSSGGNPAFPARWLYGLYPALPGDEFVLSPSLMNWRHIEARLGRRAFINLTPATGARTTRFCRTLQRRRLPVVNRSQAKPALRFRFMPTLPASTATRPNVRDDGQRPSEWDGMG